MAENKKVMQWAVVASLFAIAIIFVLYFRNKGNKEIQYDPLEEEEPMPEYLTYNQPPLVPGIGNIVLPPQAPIQLGDVNVTVGGSTIGGGGSGTGWSPCSSGTRFMPVITGHGGITMPDLQVPTDTYVPTEHQILDIGKYIADCSIQTITREVKTIAEFIGVTPEEIKKNGYFLRRKNGDRQWYLEKRAEWEPGTHGFDEMSGKGWVEVYYDPDNDIGVQGRRVEMSPKQICECKKGRNQYCGRYLTQQLFKDVYEKKAN